MMSCHYKKNVVQKNDICHEECNVLNAMSYGLRENVNYEHKLILLLGILLQLFKPLRLARSDEIAFVFYT